MPAFMISAIQIHDREMYSRYAVEARRALEPYNIRSLSADPLPIVYEGIQPANHMMIAQFETVEAMSDFYNSEAYRKASEIRRAASTARFLMGMKALES